MTTIFLVCAVVGGTILVFQFVMTFIGGAEGDADVVDDIPDASDGDFGGDLDAGDPHGSTSVFGVLSFRTIVAAVTFFGIAGMTAKTGGLPLPAQLIVAVLCGLGAMYGLYYLMRSIYGLAQTGNLKLTNTIGHTATVYLTIPGNSAGQGKVQMKVQDRLEEFPAITLGHEKLGTGAKVVVVNVVSGNTLEVEPLRETVETTA